jgi:hypothetical protein
MKIKPFFSKRVSYFFIGTLILVQPYWVAEIYANFAYFHGHNDIYLKTRPWEALCRDLWWISTTIYLFWIIRTQYNMTVKGIIYISPRFAIILFTMILSIIFAILDTLASTTVLRLAGRTGLNPFWKMGVIFKCMTNCTILDDFKVALDRLRAYKISRLNSFSGYTADGLDNSNLVATWEEIERETHVLQEVRSLNSNHIQTSGAALGKADKDLTVGRSTDALSV